MKISEKNFITELKRRNEDALAFVVENYGGLMRSVIRRVLYEYPEDGEECLYDAVLKIWEHIDSFDGSSPFKGWAAAVAKNTALDRLRKIRRIEPAVDIDDLPLADTSRITDDALFNEFFSELISCLSDSDKELFIRLFWKGETMDEVTAAMGMTKGAAYNRVSRGKKKIIEHNSTMFRGGDKNE